MNATVPASTPAAARVAGVCGADGRLAALVQRMIDLSLRGLPRMFDAGKHRFYFRRRRIESGAIVCEGESLRYGAIVLLGTPTLRPEQQRPLFAGETAVQFCERLIGRLTEDVNLGDLALLTWAAAELRSDLLPLALERLRQRSRDARAGFTVEAAWVVSALTAASAIVDVSADARLARDRLMTAFSPRGNVFAHWTDGGGPWSRRHVCCFADQVYPTQALARFHATFGDDAALDAAARCARRFCELQGAAGQWWWHYHAETGDVIEGYPVYTVHQDSMAPMALLDVQVAGGPEFAANIRRGLEWMIQAAELPVCLIDDNEALIWRKIARGGGKRVRQWRAALSRLNPHWRGAWLDRKYPPTEIDYEDRPYHLGWILHAWLGGLQ